MIRPLYSKIRLSSILFAVLYPLLFIGILAVIVYLTGLATFNTGKLSDVFVIPASFLMLAVSILLVFGEEYGWRGFLLANLAEVKGKIFAANIVGIIWALWHAPFIYGLARSAEMEYPVLLMLIQMGAVFIFSIPFAYSYFLSRNIVSPMLFHMLWNIFNPIVLGNFYRNSQGIMEGNLLWINGEGLAGTILGLPFFIWYLTKNKIKRLT